MVPLDRLGSTSWTSIFVGVSVELFNVGGWLTHGDLALEAGVDFLAVVEHWLIPARVRGEWARLRRRGLGSIWAPACQETSHVGNAGVGVVSLKGAPLALPTFASAQFQRFFDCGGAVGACFPMGWGRFLNLVVLYGYQGSDTDVEQRALTEQLFDAALADLAVVARSSPCLPAGDFNVEPTRVKGSRLGSGLTWMLPGLMLRVSRLRLRVNVVVSLLVVVVGIFLVGCPLAAAAFLSCSVSASWWLQPLFALSTAFDCDRWSCRVTGLFGVLLSGLLLGFRLLTNVGVLSLLRSREFGRFMMIGCVLCLLLLSID